MKNNYIYNIIAQCVKVRAFENALLELFASNLISGTTHTCIGQELSGVAVGSELTDGDLIFSNHRCHGHYLGYTNDYFGLAAEILGHEKGVNQGFGGSQHICIPGKFYSNGILGGMLPYALGLTKNLKAKNVSVCFMGDGSFGEGILHEAFNLANLNKLPVLFFVEDNGIAQSTKTTTTNLVSKKKLFNAHNIKVLEVSDANELLQSIKNTICEMRVNPSPMALIWKCDRHAPHSKGDDTRSAEEIKQFLSKDYLEALCHDNDVDYHEMYAEADFEIKKIFKDLSRNQPVHHLKIQKPNDKNISLELVDLEVSNLRMNKRICEAIESAILDKGGTILGEDIAGEYGGAFKVTKGLTSKFGNQVVNMPISEAAIVGYAAGLSTSSLPVVAEIMFGDFLGLAADQIINHVSKFGIMHTTYTPRLIIRTPVGGGRGYGATHSQNLEKVFGGIQGVTLYHLSFLHNVENALTAAATNPGCTIVTEPKLQYGMSKANLPSAFQDLFHLRRSVVTHEQEINVLSCKVIPASVSLICTGTTLPNVINAAKKLLIEHEVGVDIICPRTLYPLTGQNIILNLLKEKTLIVDESHEGYGFSDHVSSKIGGISQCFNLGLEFPFYPSASHLEKQMMITDDVIINKVIGLI